jgi:hypothetical protein
VWIRDALQTISTDNATRVATNDNAVAVAVRTFGTGRKVYVVPAQLSRRVLPGEIETIRRLPDNKTGHIPLFLRMYVGKCTFKTPCIFLPVDLTLYLSLGMPVRVKANQCVVKGVANGASAIVHHIDWDARRTFTLQTDGTWLASAQPLNLYVDIAGCTSRILYPSTPANWPASVMPIHQTTASIRRMVPSLSIRGFPIVPAFGTTVHGVQGQTLDAAAVANLRPAHVPRVDTHALYVSLSWLRTRHGLHWIGSLPTETDFTFFRPDADVLLEDARFKRLANKTLDLFDRVAPCVSSFCNSS